MRITPDEDLYSDIALPSLIVSPRLYSRGVSRRVLASQILNKLASEVERLDRKNYFEVLTIVGSAYYNIIILIGLKVVC